MNSVILIGRLTKNPEIRYTGGENPLAVCNFTVAIDRPTRGEEKKTDFPRITVLGKIAENCERYLSKGSLVGIKGRIQTGSYTNKEGKTVYTTDVVAENVEFLSYNNGNSQPEEAPMPSGYSPVDDDDLPF